MTVTNFEWQRNIQCHEASRGLSVTAELLVCRQRCLQSTTHASSYQWCVMPIKRVHCFCLHYHFSHESRDAVRSRVYPRRGLSCVCSSQLAPCVYSVLTFSRLSLMNGSRQFGGQASLTNNEFRATRSATQLHSPDQRAPARRI